MYNVLYLGNMPRVCEYIWHNEEFNLKMIICEKERVNDDLFNYSQIRDIPLIELNNKEHLKEILKENSKEKVIISCSFCMKIPVDILDGSKVFNIHLAELPKYKGRNADYWAMMSDEKWLGTTLHVVTNKFDDGDIIAIEKVPNYYWKTQHNIYNEQLESVPLLLISLLKYLKTGVISCKNETGECFPPINSHDKTIDIKIDNPIDMFNKVKSQEVYRGAKLIIGENCFYLKNISFIRKYMEKDFQVIDNILYVKYQDGITIKSNNFYYGFNNN